MCHMFRIWPLHTPLSNVTSISTDANSHTPELSARTHPNSCPNIHYVTTSVNERMICPFSLCESLDHFTYQCPMIIEYKHRQLTLIQNHTPSLPIEPVNTLTPSIDMVHVFSPEPEALPTPPWFLDDFYEEIPPNPPNSPIYFPTKILHPTTFFNPQYLDIWFMSSETSLPPDNNPMMTSPK
jgi:hypothetical protein